jgi:predicted RND superfamily exporter protein
MKPPGPVEASGPPWEEAVTEIIVGLVVFFVLTVVLGPALWSSRIWWSKADRVNAKDKHGRPQKEP